VGSGSKSWGVRLGFRRTGYGGGARLLYPVLQRCANKRCEKRMRFKWFGLEFRMELATEEPRMVGSFHDLDVVLVGGAAGNS